MGNEVVLKDECLICNECGELMFPQMGECSTLVGYSSPQGHNHDDNCLFKCYACKNNHTRVISLQRSCPACDWMGKEKCFCHDGLKVKKWPIIPKVDIYYNFFKII